MYAIILKRKNKFLYGIRDDLSENNPDRIKYSYDKAKVFDSEADAKLYMAMHKISHVRSHMIVKIKITIDEEGNQEDE